MASSIHWLLGQFTGSESALTLWIYPLEIEVKPTIMGISWNIIGCITKVSERVSSKNGPELTDFFQANLTRNLRDLCSTGLRGTRWICHWIGAMLGRGGAWRGNSPASEVTEPYTTGTAQVVISLIDKISHKKSHSTAVSMTRAP